VASRFYRLSDWIVVQEFVESRYDWRVGVLNGSSSTSASTPSPRPPSRSRTRVNGHLVFCRVESVPADSAPGSVVGMGIAAGNAIGKGLYGVDLKATDGDCCVIEVNDNPSLEGGEDTAYPEVYARIIGQLLGSERRRADRD